MTRLILIRHGETDYNLERKYCGFSDPSLNATGLWQVRRLAARLEDIRVYKVYSSDLKRACETAEIVFKGNSIKKTEKFRELNFGIFEGLTYENIMKKHPKLFRDWINDPEKVRIPDGETLEDLTKRLENELSSLLSEHKNETLVIVTHAGPIKVILSRALKYDPKNFWQIDQEASAVNIIDYAGELDPKVIKINDISHLKGHGGNS